jgi:LysR family nod box-dependent transcriptional activator
MHPSQFDLNQLVALDALLTEKGVSAAADRVFLSQPAMSSALKRLRKTFDDELLVPVGRRMIPTQLGVELLLCRPGRNGKGCQGLLRLLRQPER